MATWFSGLATLSIRRYDAIYSPLNDASLRSDWKRWLLLFVILPFHMRLFQLLQRLSTRQYTMISMEGMIVHQEVNVLSSILHSWVLTHMQERTFWLPWGIIHRQTLIKLRAIIFKHLNVLCEFLANEYYSTILTSYFSMSVVMLRYACELLWPFW